ncbi:hypothetical protein [uncultured Lacinutrix sp.]|uniref:hypothetical protein n=1 Tax=uncultured Lacinutrix sp. TaxID=574032 RepID=UPI00261C225E|nr:hypothetical protein [uncultured Lacinutrix sp.]
MVKNYALFLIISLFFFSISSCTKEENYETIPNQEEQESPVIFNIENVPYQTLSEYNFFKEELKDLEPVFGVLPYELNSSLFSDYAKKKRFVWMPENVKATYVSDHLPFNFPIGTVLIKNFYFENIQPNNTKRIIETRLMIKKADQWIFAEYLWNEAQSEATLTSEGSVVNIEWIQDNEIKNVNYRVPAAAECFTCHNKFGTPVPIGPKPQNIFKDLQYSDGLKNQMQKWVEMDYLEPNYPSNIIATVNWKDTSLSLDLRARSYIDINCAHCHSEESYCEYRPMRFAFNENDDLINMGVCVEPDTNVNSSLTHIIKPNSPNESVAFFRMSSTLEEYRMPLIGRTLKHTQGIRLVEEWIESLTQPCQ